MSTTPRASQRSDAIRIGTSGWSYDHWNGVLYPPGLPVAKRLARYVEEFDTVELNASFYRWPKDATFEGWRKRLPEGFTMSVKAQRGLTHYRRLKSPEPWVERFERAWKGLGDRAEALLVQVHPELERDDSRLEYFLDRMPDWIPTAMELRHPSWDDPAVYAILERHHAAYVVMSGAGLTCVPRATSDLVYVRMHGPPQDSMYAGSYTDDELRWWAGKLTGWHDEGRRVLLYFNNDLGGHAIRNARTLKDLLGL